MPMRQHPSLHVTCDTPGCPGVETSTADQFALEHHLPRLAADSAPFLSMLNTLGWTTKVMHDENRKSFWGWHCPTCSKAVVNATRS